jgi:hypothetical protein
MIEDALDSIEGQSARLKSTSTRRDRHQFRATIRQDSECSASVPDGPKEILLRASGSPTVAVEDYLQPSPLSSHLQS